MVDPGRLITPQDKFQEGFPELHFAETYQFRTTGEPVFLTDPTYLADVYNGNDANADYLRTHGVIVMDFGGDVSGPVWFQDPYVMLPISNHIAEEEWDKPPTTATILAEEVGTDSGSFIFLPITDNLPPDIREEIERVQAVRNGAALSLPAGLWKVYYEQWETPIGSYPSFYRNIVVKRS